MINKKPGSVEMSKSAPRTPAELLAYSDSLIMKTRKVIADLNQYNAEFTRYLAVHRVTAAPQLADNPRLGHLALVSSR